MEDPVRDRDIALNLTTIGLDFRAGFQTRLRSFFSFVVEVLLKLLVRILPFLFEFLVLLLEDSQLTHAHSLVLGVFGVDVKEKRCKI